MDLTTWVLSIILGSVVLHNFYLRYAIKRISERAETNEIENKLTKLSAEKLKIKNDIDRTPLDKLVKRKRDRDGKNS